MKRISYISLILAFIIALVSSVVQATPVNNGVLISQVQTGTVASASEEFIELYNASSDNVDVSTWRLEYFSSTANNFDNPTRKIPLHGVIGSHNYFLAASTNYLVDKTNESFSATLAKSGGHVRLVSQATDASPVVVKDLVAWGSAGHPEGNAAPAPPESKSLSRKTDLQSNYVDTDNNLADFNVADVPNPRSSLVLAPVVEELPPNDPLPGPLPTATEVPILPDPSAPEEAVSLILGKLPLQLSEIFPNPAVPASDDTDEFIELYNPNSSNVSLNGYKLQSGNTFYYSYTFSSESIPAQSYRAFLVTKTGDVLANSGSKVRLIDPDGNVVDQTSYTTAAEGQSWVWLNDKWQWTNTPTPNAANSVIGTTVTAKVGTTKKATTAKPKTVKVASTSKPKTTKVSAAKKTKKTGVAEKGDTPVTSVIHPVILAVITVIAVGYALYEYRDDIANRIHHLRRNRTDRRVARQEQ